MTIDKPEAVKPLRIGIVGCGAVTRTCHLPFMRRVPNLEVPILCDTLERNAVLTQKQFGLDARITTRVEDFQGQVDAALVAVPPRFHAPVAIQLLEMGLDVLCEKPLAATSADAQKMVDAANRCGRWLAVGHMMRFHPNGKLLLQFLESGQLGEPREIVAEYGAELDWAMATPSYYNRNASAGGVLFDTGIHIIDRVLALFGDLQDIEYEDDSYGGFESNASLRGRMQINGRDVPCRMAFSWTHPLDNCVRVVGTEATAEARLREPSILTVFRTVGGQPMKMQVPSGGKPRNPYLDQALDFAEAVRLRRPPSVLGSSSVRVLQVIEKAYSVRKAMPQPWVEANAA